MTSQFPPSSSLHSNINPSSPSPSPSLSGHIFIRATDYALWAWPAGWLAAAQAEMALCIQMPSRFDFAKVEWGASSVRPSHLNHNSSSILKARHRSASNGILTLKRIFLNKGLREIHTQRPRRRDSRKLLREICTAQYLYHERLGEDCFSNIDG